MSARKIISVVVFTTLITLASGENNRLIFPHVVVGEDFTTILDLSNKGDGPFDGTLSMLADDSSALSILVNGTSSESSHSIQIPARSSIRLHLTQSGPVVAGHVLISDTLEFGTSNMTDWLQGNALFQWKSAGTLLDSIGVPAGKEYIHFFLPSSSIPEPRRGWPFPTPSPPPERSP